MTEIKKFNAIARICPSDENYRKSEGRLTYDYLHYSSKVEFSDKSPIIHIYDYKGMFMNEEREVEVYFPSDRAFKRCKRLYEEGYYSKLPFQKE